MADLNVSQLLLLLTALAQTLAAGVWALAIRLEVAPRVPGWHWVGAALWAAVVLGLSLARPLLGDWYGHDLPHMLAPGVFILARMGVELLFRCERHDGEHLTVICLALAGAAIGAQPEVSHAWPVAYSAVLSSACLVRCMQCVRGRLVEELHLRSARFLLVPVALVAGYFVARFTMAVLQPDQAGAPLDLAVGSNPLLLLLLMFGTITFHLMLALMVSLRMVRKLQQVSVRDPLTGLLNRRGLHEQCRIEPGLCVLAVDVDHFKHINDGHGHAVGDLALQHLAELLRRHARASDLAVRLGGEEFLLLMPATPLAAAQEAAERLRSAVAAQPLRRGDITLPMAVSVGVAQAGVGEALGGLIERADAALYQAKHDGRNRVVMAAA